MEFFSYTGFFLINLISSKRRVFSQPCQGGWGRSSSSGRSSSRSWGSWGRRSTSSSSSRSWASSSSRVGGRSPIAKPKQTVFKRNNFGQTQYSSFSKPSRPMGSYSTSSGTKYGYRTPGHGTNWGTSFSGGTGVYDKKKGFSKKVWSS